MPIVPAVTTPAYPLLSLPPHCAFAPTPLIHATFHTPRPSPPGSASARAQYSAADLRKQSAKAIQLAEAARVSVAHSSFVDYLLRLSAERYAVLAQWPDFTSAYGKDFYYRAHPEDLKAFYAAVDSFHTAYDTLTEFESLSQLAAELQPSECGGRSWVCVWCLFLCVLDDRGSCGPVSAMDGLGFCFFVQDMCLACPLIVDVRDLA